MISDYACNTFYELSAKGFSQYANFEGEEFTNLKNGYIQLINHLKSKLPNTVIKLGEPVSNVNYTEDIVQVSTPKSIYQAKYVVMTVSLGILKSKYNTLFTPALPDAKISAINRLGFGVVNKLFYVFEKPVFDDPDVSGVQFLWANDTDFKLRSNLRCNLSAKFSQFYKSFNVLTVPPKRRNIFFSFFTGENSIYSESLSDECLIDVMNDLLTKFFPQFNIPRPKALVRLEFLL
jgi:spermine oxidase